MIGLAELKKINAAPPAKNDNFNRDSSRVKSAQGWVIHSGIHRSTAFIYSTPPDSTYCERLAPAAAYWLRQGQAAINGFIEAIIDGGNTECAELTAISRAWPNWSIAKGRTIGTQGSPGWTAKRDHPCGVIHCGAGNLKELDGKLRIIANRECPRRD